MRQKGGKLKVRCPLLGIHRTHHGAGETKVYNFLVTAKDDAWSLPAYEYERDRFGEYTSPALKERFKSLTAQVIEELKSYPALFAYEGIQKDVRIGYLRRIKERARSILIEYDFEPNIPAIPFAKIAPLEGRLDIEKLGNEPNPLGTEG
jgi:hypothetical protein